MQESKVTNCKMSTQRLENEFQCTICYNPISDCYITRCGHVYCRPCIQQTVNRHHRCPFCNTDLKDFANDVFKNYHFNTLKKIIDEEKQLQNKQYLSRLFQLPQVQMPQSIHNKALMGPIEDAIVMHFQNALLQYKQHAQYVYKSLRAVEEKKLLLGLPALQNNQVIVSIHKSLIPNLPNPLISPEILMYPTQIQIQLPGKKIHKSILPLSMQSPLASLLPHLDNICSEVNIHLQGSFPKQLRVNGREMGLEQPLLLLAGKKIVVGGLPFEERKYCYSFKWDEEKVTDFFVCKTCNVRWICSSCIDACHQKHEAVVQLKDHKTSWSCCYCVTKCECKIINKNTAI